jgi:hypothetical protein
MSFEPVIIRPAASLPRPLVYNDSIDTASMTNVVLIDSIVSNKKQLYDSVNANTFPIIYNYDSSIDDLLALFRQKFPASSIQRIALVFHDKGANFMTPFMNGKRLFEGSDLEENQTSFTENVSFLISCIKEFRVGHIDYLACNTLQYSNWKSYYALLASQTSVVVGASNNETGNINYGGDWVMENTSENVRDLYFNANISNYASTLTLTNIFLDGANGDVGLRMNLGDEIEYYNTTTTTWTAIGSGNWPVRFNNNTPSSPLNIVATQNLTITSSYGGASGYFIAGSTNITFDGIGYTITIDNITDYPGFIDNFNYISVAYADIIVQNFRTATIGGSTLSTRAGWLCQQQFGTGVSGNQIIGCINTGAVNGAQSGGIVGGNAGKSGGSILFTNCTNSGSIDGDESGGIAGIFVAQSGGSATFTNCINSGLIGGLGAGGICGVDGGYDGSVTFTNCGNSGSINGLGAGGIAGSFAGQTTGSATFTGCTNNGIINGEYAGGIAGYNAGAYGGSATITGCTNSGSINGSGAGGIAGYQAGFNSGSVEFTMCTNRGLISGEDSGGIAGYQVAATNGTATFTNCINTGVISQQGCGGIVGSSFAYNTTNTCSITDCYSIGDINGIVSGGITGASVGLTDSVTYLPKIVDISNCYSLGAIASNAGGICGGNGGAAYTGAPTINITNCYSLGVITGTGSGIVASTLPITPNQVNTYVANGAWTDASANASGALIGYPTDITTNNPGTTWTTIASNTPYVLSSFNAQIYNPNSASSSSQYYTTDPGLFFGPSYNYQILYNNQVSNVQTTRVFVSKGSTPYYYSYNSNTFEFTNTNPSTSTEVIDVSITSSTGVLSLIVACFKKGTKILCENDVYIPIEELKIGDLVKTYKHGYQKIIMCAHSGVCEYSKNRANKLYTYSREKNPELIEDLHLTGGHSLLLDTLTEEESSNMREIKWAKADFMVEDKYKLLACFSDKLCIAAEQNAEIYHFTLEPPENAKPSHVYGIYANGILAESCSQRAMEKSLGKNNMLCNSKTSA